MKTTILKQLICSLALGLLVVLGGCKDDIKKEGEGEKPFVLNDSIAKLIRIDTVKTHLLEGKLELNGQITFNQNTVVNVMPLVGGTVETVNVQLGEHVKQGQVIATIKSSDLAELQSQLSDATANLNIAKKNLEVATDLAQKGINSQKEVIGAQQEVNRDEAAVNSINKKLSIIGGSVAGNEVAVKSPVNGYIVDRKINPNQVVDAGGSDPMFIVSDLKDVWVIASVYETDIEKIKMDEKVTINTVAYPDKVYKGNISYISNVLDPDNKTMKVRVTLANPDNELKPEMFAKVILDFKQQIQVPCISPDAIVFDESKNFVVIYEGKDKLSVRRIEVYPAHRDLLFIRSGLKEGEMVISKNQLLIYNALISQ